MSQVDPVRNIELEVDKMIAKLRVSTSQVFFRDALGRNRETRFREDWLEPNLTPEASSCPVTFEELQESLAASMFQKDLNNLIAIQKQCFQELIRFVIAREDEFKAERLFYSEKCSILELD
jgi:outer membrane cobalamin receptor